MQITKTIQVDGFGDGFRAFAYTNKAGADKVGMRISVADLLADPKLAKLVGDQVVSFAFTPDQAADVARSVPATREALKGAGVKVPATRKVKA